MKTIIKALVITLYQQDSWSESVIDPEDAVNALCEVAAILKGATIYEIASLDEALKEMAKSTTNQDFSDYCNEFIDFFINNYDENWS